MAKNMHWGTFEQRFTDEELAKYRTGAEYMRGGKIDKFFDALSTFSYLSGGYELEKNKRLEMVEKRYAGDPQRISTEQSKVRSSFANPWFASLTYITDKDARDTMQFALRHRVEPSAVYDDRFAGGLARNIVSDPTSFVPSGAVKGVVQRGGGSVFKRLPTVAQRPLVAGGAAFDAGKTRIKNAALQQLGAGLGWIGRQAKGARDVMGEMFEPGYKVKQLGPKMSAFYDDYMDMVMTRRGAVQQAAHEATEMGRPYKRMGAEAMQYVERGISTGIATFDQYLDDTVKPFMSDMLQRERLAGFDIGEMEQYAPHVLSKRGMELVDEFGSEEAVIKFLKDQAQVLHGKTRTIAGSAEEINKVLGEKFFVDDLWEAVNVRAQRSAKDIATAGWLGDIQKKFGLPEAAEVTKQTFTAKAMAAQKQIQRNMDLIGPFERAIRDIREGGSPAHFLSNVVDMAASGPLRGKLSGARALVADITELGTRHQGAVHGIRDTKRYILTQASEITREFQRSRGGKKLSRETLVAAQERIYGAMERLPRAEERLDIATANLRAETGKIQTAIIEPARERIRALTQQASEKRTVHIKEAAVDDIAGYSQSVRPEITTLMPTDMTKFLDELEEVSIDQSLGRSVDTSYMWLMNKWKKSVTLGLGPLIHGAFFGRNIQTGTLQNIQEIGARRTLRGIYDAARLQVGAGSFETMSQGRVSAKIMQQMMRESGQMGGTGMSDVQVARQMYPTAMEKIFGLGGRLMQWSEATVREPLFLESIRVKTAQQTREIIKDVHFDYAPEALTKAERFLKKYGLPFYTFERFNIQRQLGKLVADPRMMDRPGKLQREATRAYGMEEEYESRKDWQRDQYLLPNPIVPGTFVGVSHPLTSLMTGPSDIYQMVSPVKNLLEIMAVKAGWGSEEYKQERVKALYEKLAFGRYISTTKRMTDPDINASQKIMYEMGLPTYEAVPQTVSFEEFENYRYRMIQPTKEQEYAAWLKAGQPKGFRIMRLGPTVGGVGVEADTVIKAPWWKFWQKDEVIEALRHQYDLAAVPQEIYEMGQGYPWTQAEWAHVAQFEGAARTQAVTQKIVEWDEWKRAQYKGSTASMQQRMAAWVRSGKPYPAIDRVYKDDDGNIVGIASFDEKEIRTINKYMDRNVKLSNAAYEWAFVQSDQLPEEWILAELDKKNTAYWDAKRAQEELKGFDVDAPIDATEVNMTQSMEYTTYRTGRVDYEQQLIEKALGRGEVN